MSETIAVNRYQQKIAFDSNDHIGKTILEKGIYDPKGISYIEKVLSQMDRPVALDIGANIGNHALVMARHCQMVYLFEPQPHVIALLNKTQALNQLNNWEIMPIGLSDAAETLTLYRNLSGNNGASTFIPELKSSTYSTDELRVEIGDRIIQEKNLSRLDFIKIDVEGFEARAIAGLKDTIARFRPVIVMEWNNAITKKQFEEYQLFTQVLPHYLSKGVINNTDKSRWKGKWFANIRRAFYKLTHQKAPVLETFNEAEDYQHVILVPNEMAGIFKNL